MFNFYTKLYDTIFLLLTLFYGHQISDSRDCDPPDEANATDAVNGTMEKSQEEEEESEGVGRMTVEQLDELIPEVRSS